MVAEHKRVGFNPDQLRDPGGEGGGQWVSDPAAGLKDTLKLAGKINLAPGETLVGSWKVDGDQAGARMALTEQNGKRMLRLGLGGEGYGQRDRDAGIAAWNGNGSPPPLPPGERQRLKAEQNDLIDQHDEADGDPERQAEIDARLDDIQEQLTGDDIGFNGTAQLDEYSWGRLADRLRPALAEAVEQEKTENDAHDEIDRLAAAGNVDPVRLAELRQIARIEAGTPDEIIFATGIVPGSAWGDVHFSVEMDDLTQGPRVVLGVTPKGAPDDWGDGESWTGQFDTAETRRFLRLLDKLSGSAPGKRRRNGFDPHQLRDPGGENGGQWVSSGGASAAVPKVNGTLLAKGAGHVGSAAAKAAELGFFGVRSWDEFKLAIQGVRTVPAPAVAAKIAAGKVALGVASGAIDAYEVGKYWNDDWAKVTFATIGAGLTVASVAAPPAAPFLLGAGLGLEALSHSKKVNEAVGDFTAPGWEWIDKQVVKPAAKLPSKLMNGKSPKPRKVAPAAVNAASGS